MDFILREEKGQCWENIGCTIYCKSSTWTSLCSRVCNFITDFFFKMPHKRLSCLSECKFCNETVYLLFWVLKVCLATQIKNDSINFIENSDARLYKNPTYSSLFLRYSKDYANLLFWVIWAGLVMPTKIEGINL